MKKLFSLILILVMTISFISAFAENDGVLKNDGTWKITANTAYSGREADYMIDGDESTYWHSYYETKDGKNINIAKPPHKITVDFGKEVTLSGWGYIPRSSNASGLFKAYNIHASTDGVNFKQIYTGNFNFDSGRTLRTAEFPKMTMRAIRIDVTDSEYGYGVASEILFYENTPPVTEGSAGNKPAAPKAPVTEDGKNPRGTAYLDRTGWTGEGKCAGNHIVEKALDGNTKSHWHSYFEAQDDTVVYNDKPPFEIEFILPEPALSSGISLHPRSDSSTGRIIVADILAKSSEEDEYVPLFENYEFENTIDEKEIYFWANLKIKRVKIIVREGIATYGTLGEFNLWEKADAYPEIPLSEFIEFEKNNGICKINPEDFTALCDDAPWDGHTADKVVDGTNGYWQTDTLESFPVILDVDLGKIHAVNEIVYIPRQSKDLHGNWHKVSIYYSADGNDWKDFIKDKALEASIAKKRFTLEEEVSARYFRFEIKEAGFSRASCQEIEFYQTKASYNEENKERSEKYVLTIGNNVIKSETDGVASEKTLDVAPYIVDGTTLIPLRGLVEEMGAGISWDGETKTITLSTKNAAIKLQILNKRVYVEDKKLGSIMYTLKSFPVIKDSRTFIPVRFVSEQLGYNVAWDGATQSVTITK